MFFGSQPGVNTCRAGATVIIPQSSSAEWFKALCLRWYWDKLLKTLCLILCKLLFQQKIPKSAKRLKTETIGDCFKWHNLIIKEVSLPTCCGYGVLWIYIFMRTWICGFQILVYIHVHLCFLFSLNFISLVYLATKPTIDCDEKKEDFLVLL